MKSYLRQGVYDSFHQASKDFVQEVFDQVKHLLGSKDERKFTQLNRPKASCAAGFNRVNSGWRG